MNKKFILVVAALAMVCTLTACKVELTDKPQPNVKKVTADIQVNAKGRTVEQENVKRRLEEDNKVGAIKHLYIISAYSGQIIDYSTVKGKVTSSAKRLTNPDKFYRVMGSNYSEDKLAQRMGDDGTYGSSVPYVYWWDSADKYHQAYVSGGTLMRISDQPRTFGSVTMNVEAN